MVERVVDYLDTDALIVPAYCFINFRSVSLAYFSLHGVNISIDL